MKTTTMQINIRELFPTWFREECLNRLHPWCVRRDRHNIVRCLIRLPRTLSFVPRIPCAAKIRPTASCIVAVKEHNMRQHRSYRQARIVKSSNEANITAFGLQHVYDQSCEEDPRCSQTPRHSLISRCPLPWGQRLVKSTSVLDSEQLLRTYAYG